MKPQIASKFKIGDKVIVRRGTGLFMDVTGTIVDINPDWGETRYDIELLKDHNIGGVTWFECNHLSFAESQLDKYGFTIENA